MPLFRQTLRRRDASLLLLGAVIMHFWSIMFSVNPSDVVPSSSTCVNTHLTVKHLDNKKDIANTKLIEEVVYTITQLATATETATETLTVSPTPSPTSNTLLTTLNTSSPTLPPTSVIAHAPGWTVFRNLYMSNGTLFLVSDSPSSSFNEFPEIRLMISTGIDAQNTPENILAREPGDREMRVISVHEAGERWGWASSSTGDEWDNTKTHRVWTVEGASLLVNEPFQFLDHFYHFVGELFLGAQAFYHGAFSSSNDPPPLTRAIFMHSTAEGWRDRPGFNAYFLRAAFPSLALEHTIDWDERARVDWHPESSAHAHAGPSPNNQEPINGDDENHGQKHNYEPSRERAWHFPLALLSDRSAAHRGFICGSVTQRTAAEAFAYMHARGKLRDVHSAGWWGEVRERVWKFAGVPDRDRAISTRVPAELEKKMAPESESIHSNLPDSNLLYLAPAEGLQSLLSLPETITITYISRQSSSRRKLIKEDHNRLVAALAEMVMLRNEKREEIVQRNARREASAVENEEDWVKAHYEVVPPRVELQMLEAEHMNKDEQVQAAARTTILLGVHGNGLTHLVFMPPTRLSSVIEIFYPGGFAHDYQWTTRALGMRHWAVWNDTHHTYPNKPEAAYPEGFQGDEIPVYAPAVVQLIEDRIDGTL